MNRLSRCWVAGIVGLWLCGTGFAAEQWVTGTLMYVYPQGNGDFVLIFDVDSPNCPVTGPRKYMNANVGQNGMTAEGAKKIYSAALAALLTRSVVQVAFDDATTACFINRLVVVAQ